MLRYLRTIVALGSLVVVPATALAQASIVGTVKDASGAVLPGVTVEASSPALIEKTRSVTTNGAGQYSIEDLRPGTYTVTFSLAGFSDGQARRDRAERQLRRDRQRRSESRRRGRDDHRERRGAGGRRDEHAQSADSQRPDGRTIFRRRGTTRRSRSSCRRSTCSRTISRAPTPRCTACSRSTAAGATRGRSSSTA